MATLKKSGVGGKAKRTFKPPPTPVRLSRPLPKPVPLGGGGYGPFNPNPSRRPGMAVPRRYPQGGDMPLVGPLPVTPRPDATFESIVNAINTFNQGVPADSWWDILYPPIYEDDPRWDPNQQDPQISNPFLDYLRTRRGGY